MAALTVGAVGADERESSDAAATASPGGGGIQMVRLTLAVERWPGAGAALYGPALGIFLALLRAGDADAAEALHDGRERKRFALSPLRVKPLGGARSATGAMAQAELDVALWDERLLGSLIKGTSMALDEALDVVGHPARLLDCQLDTPTSFAGLLDAPRTASQAGQTLLWARFTTPTVFSWGRGVDGRHRYSLLPAPELVVGSWLRAWQAGGGPETVFENDGEWLRERIRIHAVRSLQTTVAHTGKTPMSGFVGEVAYEWCGATPGGHRTLRALGGFARYCGTGAKTAYGLGQTETWTR